MYNLLYNALLQKIKNTHLILKITQYLHILVFDITGESLTHID